MTQGFFQEVVLGRALVEKADQSRGRFLTFLLTTLKKHLVNEHRKRNAQKRIPKGKSLAFEQLNYGSKDS